MKINEIEELLEKNNLLDKNRSIVMATVEKSYYALSFDDHGVAIMPVTFMGKLSGEINILPNSEIADLKFRKKILGYSVNIELTNGEQYKYVVRPVMVGFKEQKQGVESLTNKYISK